MTHQEKTTAAAAFDVIDVGWVRNFIGIKTRTFISYTDRKSVLFALKRNRNTFTAISLVSVQNGVGDGFGKAYQDIAMRVGRKIVAGSYGVYEGFDFGYILGVGRKSKIRVQVVHSQIFVTESDGHKHCFQIRN